MMENRVVILVSAAFDLITLSLPLPELFLSMLLLLYGRGRYYTSSKRVQNPQVKTQAKKQHKQVIVYVSRCISKTMRPSNINSIYYNLHLISLK